MDITKRALIFLTFFICCGCLALLAASLATQEWMIARPIRIGVSSSLANATTDDSKFKGVVHFGLFEGSKSLNHGFGTRKTQIYVRQEMAADPEFLHFGLWLMSVLSVALAMVFALVSAVFAVINTVLTPVEVITGLAGLYVWNAIGMFLAWVGSGCWLGQFLSRLWHNVMSKEERLQHWSSAGRATLGYSFWLVVAAGCLFGLNLALVRLAGRPPMRSRTQLPGAKHPEGAIMLY